MKRLVIHRRPYGPPLTASRSKHCFMLTKKSKRNLKKLMMKLDPQRYKNLIKFCKNTATARKKRTLTKKIELKNFSKKLTIDSDSPTPITSDQTLRKTNFIKRKTYIRTNERVLLLSV